MIRALCIAVVLCLRALGHAADPPYPIKPVTVIVPFAPGGSADILQRGVAKGLTELWGQTVVIENRPGAASMIGAEIVANAPPEIGRAHV